MLQTFDNDIHWVIIGHFGGQFYKNGYRIFLLIIKNKSVINY